jgi:hypothetical protein
LMTYTLMMENAVSIQINTEKLETSHEKSSLSKNYI